MYFVSDLYSKVFDETDYQKSIRIATMSDPTFDVSKFAEELREDTIPKLIKAFLSGKKNNNER